MSKELKDSNVHLALVFHGIRQSETFRVRDKGVSISMADNKVRSDRWND
jgi:hypothetical protein